MRFDALIIGAGLTGATAARLLADAGLSVAVVEKRGHPGGNCADVWQDGILRNLHGGHIFHTNSSKVWDFVNRFGQFQPYTHRVASFANGHLYSFPINLLTLQQLYGVCTPEYAARAIEDHHDELVDLFFRGYSEKQWGRKYEDIPGAVMGRIPWRATYDDRYFTDTYQGLPVEGYTALIGGLLAGIPVCYNDDFTVSKAYWLKQARRVLYTGSIDALLGYRYGKLEYRSLRFEDFTVDGDFQGCATVNYPGAELPYTRILEWRHYGWHPASSGKSLCTREYPQAEGEPYYPVKSADNMRRWQEYATALAAEYPQITAAGRLGRYQYMNMDQAIAQAMAIVEKWGQDDG